MRCLYYACGGGLGHVTRMLALIRVLRQHIAGEHRLLFNSPFVQTVQPEIQRLGIRAVSLPASATPHAAQDFVAEQIACFSPELWVVDTFPRGLGGELVMLFAQYPAATKVLISRTLPAAYVSHYQLNRFVQHHYQLVIAPGERSPFESLPTTCQTAPFLIRDVDELPRRAQAEKLLGLLPGQRANLLVGCGTPQECRDLVAHVRAFPAPDAPLRLALPVEVDVDLTAMPHPADVSVVRHYPVMEILPAVGHVIAQAGYNITHETCALGVPSVLYPRRRKYDDQFSRARCFHGQASPTRLPNGVHRAARMIVETLLPEQPSVT